MAAYCSRCGRGSWACVCLLGFKERMGGFHAKTTNTQAPPEPPPPDPVFHREKEPLEDLKHDWRYPQMRNLMDRMPKPFVQPLPDHDITRF